MTNPLDELKQTLLSEDVNVPTGTIVAYKAKGDVEIGVVIGVDGRELYVVTASEPKMYNATDRRAYRDDVVTTRLAKQLIVKGVKVDVQKVPFQLTQKMGRMAGRNLRYYAGLADALQQMRGA
jgi:hypothetical protein